jgi:hypothetical protein
LSEKVKSGYLYVLQHLSDPQLFKVGITIRSPEERLVEHNSNFEEYTGQIVKDTGKKWELKTYIQVADPCWAEVVFWESTGLGLIPFQRGIEISKMEWALVQSGLQAVKKAGIGPPPKPQIKPIRNREWMIKQLEGTGITMIGHYRGLVTGVEFKCEKGHLFKQSPGRLAHDKFCPLC